MLFSEVIGQSEIKAKLRGLVEHNRLSHALLLEWTGRLQAAFLLALAFAQYLMCERVSNTDYQVCPLPGESCNICPSCHKVCKVNSS